MKTFDEIKKILEKSKPELQKKYKVKELGVFGSYVTGKQKKTSDIDVLISFSEPVGLFEFIEIEEFLQKQTGTDIDLVSKKALKPRIGKHILDEVVYV